ncbi:MAG: biotin synthase BioB [Muribaculaceae bacterium]|nr:biotin synthase BioB [Muribaculaceae bacterium]
MNNNIPSSDPQFIQSIKDKGLNGEPITREEAGRLANYPDINALCDAANEVCRKWQGSDVDSCSIVNARSGLCSEDCKWCAQASRHSTGCATYNFLDPEEVMKAAAANDQAGIRKFSLVTSGRAVSKKDLHKFCNMYRRLSKETDLHLCASMGLLDVEEMQMLKDAGVNRYHCNMETSSEFFSTLCTSHTPDDKKRTIQAAKNCGLSVCSGGIIGMGETMADRIDFAFELADLNVDSVPINILNPIPGTPLQDTPLISEEEIIRTVAIFRFILPTKSLRFAGGRMRLSHDSMLRIMTGGMNGVLMGDMLTTVSNTIADDRKLFKEAGLNF